MKFHRPVKIGDEVSLYASIEAIGRTSMRSHVEAWRPERHDAVSEQATEATFTFVALDASGRPRPLVET